MALLDLTRLQSVVERLRPILAANPRAIMLVGAAFAAALVAVTVLWSSGSGYSVLYAGLSGEEGGRTIAELQKLNISYRIAEGGRVILVPAGELGRARLQLAARGVPKRERDEWAVLDNESLGVSPFVEQVHYVRAIEAALSRTIREVDGVVAAKVMLGLPKQTSFLADAPKPSASVMLQLRPGLQLSTVQVDGIVGLVASSVPGLARDNVTVVDQSGRGLTANGKEPLERIPQQLELARDINRRYERLVTELLAPVLGSGNFRVSADADVDFSQTKESLVKYGDSHVLSQDETLHTRTGDTQPIGIPGALSNRPSDTPTTAPAPAANPAAATATPPAGGTPSAGADQAAAAPAVPAPPVSTDSHKTTNYDIDRTVQYLEHPPWKLRAINVAVLINNATGRPIPAARIQSLDKLVASAIGAAQNPRITVVDLPFEDAAATGDPLPDWWREPWMRAVQDNLVLALAGLLALFGGVFPLTRRIAALPAAAGWPASRALADRNVARPERTRRGASDATPPAAAGGQDIFSIEPETVRALVANDPARTAQVIKGWIAGDRNSLKHAS